MNLTQVAASHPERAFGAKDVSGAFLESEVGERRLGIRAPFLDVDWREFGDGAGGVRAGQRDRLRA
eukprot:2090866-Pyramimonas_sp.AAC.1